MSYMRLAIVFLGLALFFAWWSVNHRIYETIEPDITQELRDKVDAHYLEEHIQKSIQKENFDDVRMYQNLAKMLEINLSKTIQEMILQENSFFKKSWRNAKAFGSGFLSGKADSAVSLGGSIVSDMTLYGDLRDLKSEGTKYKNGKDYDTFILQLSALGVGLSITQLVSVGVSTPLKIGASVIKAAKKSGQLSKPFMKIISKRLSRTIDMKILKTYNPKRIAKNINVAPIKGLFHEINGIKQYTSTTDTVALLKYVDTTNDLRKVGKLSKTYKENTKGVMKVLGKSTLRSGKSVLKVTTKLFVGVVGFILSILGFVILLLLEVL